MKQVSISKFGILMRQLKDEDFPLQVTREGKVIFYVFKEIPGADHSEILEKTIETPTSPVQPQVEIPSQPFAAVCQFSTDCNAPSIGKFLMSYVDDFGNPIAREIYLCSGHSQLQVRGVSFKKIEK